MAFKNKEDERSYVRNYYAKNHERINTRKREWRLRTEYKQKRTKCEHEKFKWNCSLCGGKEFTRCEKHNRLLRTCRLCSPRSWALRILCAHRTIAKKFGYVAPKISADDLLQLIERSPQCCGCEELLDYDKVAFEAPCLHHNHETGEVIGFAHRECNALEGQLRKLDSRLPKFLKNFFGVQA